MSANDTAAAADTTNDEVLVGISTAASALFLVLFIAGFTVIILLFINAKKKFNSHHENVDTKTFDIQHKVRESQAVSYWLMGGSIRADTLRAF